MLILVVGGLLSACGGAEQVADRGGLQRSLSTQAQALAPSLTGVVYPRSDAVAYGSDVVPAVGLGGAQVSFAGGSAATDGTGRFSAAGSFTATTEALPVQASLSGYLSSTVPWLVADGTQPVPIGLYAEPVSAPVPRPGFISGIVPHDSGGWMQSVFAEGLHAPTYDRIRVVAGANLVAYSDPAWVQAYSGITNTATMVQGDAAHGGATREQYGMLVSQAHARGMQFMMMLGIYGTELMNVQPPIWGIPPTNTAFWSAWFSAYKPIVLERAAIARDLGIEYLGVGFNQGYMLSGQTENWRQLIAAVRATGYTGKIGYFGMTYVGASANEFRSLPGNEMNGFMGLFDFLGLNVYDGIKKETPDEVLAPAQTRARMRSSLGALFDTLADAPVPLLVMIGTPSVHGAVTNQDYIEPCVICGSLAPSRVRDYQQQADLYQAAAEVIAATPTGNGRVTGLMSWGYHYRDDPHRFVVAGDSAYDKAASIRGKPAESVMKAWASRWTAPSSNTIVALYSGERSSYTVTLTATGWTVRANTGTDSTDTQVNIQRLQFADQSVNLTVGDLAHSITPAQLDSLIELYIAYINRVPDADGMAFWIGQLKAGQTLAQIGESFYAAAVQFGSLTGYTATMSDADFVRVVYRNVLGRSEPDAQGLAFWSNELATGHSSRGTLVASILASAHTFKGDAQFGYVADLLDNKIAVGRMFAINQGLVYNSSEASISHGMAIAAAVTPTSTAAAIALIGVNDGFDLY